MKDLQIELTELKAKDVSKFTKPQLTQHEKEVGILEAKIEELIVIDESKESILPTPTVSSTPQRVKRGRNKPMKMKVSYISFVDTLTDEAESKLDLDENHKLGESDFETENVQYNKEGQITSPKFMSIEIEVKTENGKQAVRVRTTNKELNYLGLMFGNFGKLNVKNVRFTNKVSLSNGELLPISFQSIDENNKMSEYKVKLTGKNKEKFTVDNVLNERALRHYADGFDFAM